MKRSTEVKITTEIWINPGIHLRELARKLNLSLPSIKYGLNKLTKDKLLIEKKEGRNLKFYINKNSQNTKRYLYQVENFRMHQLPNKIRNSLYDLLKQLKIKPLITILFGSYARGDYNRSSDLDILLIFSDKINKKSIEEQSNMISNRYNINIQTAHLKWEEFKNKFHNNTDEFLNQIKQNKIIFQGLEWWLELENECA